MQHGDGPSLSQLPPARTSTPTQLALLETPATEPNLPALRLLHSSPDGYVSFHREVNGEFRDVASIPVTELDDEGQPWLPGLREELVTDSFFSINAMYRGGTRVREREVWVKTVIEGQHVEAKQTRALVQRTLRTGPLRGLPFAFREADAVRWLTSAWVDCDGYTKGLDAPATIAGLMRAWDEERIPVPTYVVRSGRGAWAFWKLLDERNPTAGMLRKGTVTLYPDTPLQASRRARRLHQAVNYALAARLSHLGADKAAGDVARTARIPGSVHSRAGTHVELLPVLRDGVGRVYTLSELAEWLELGDVLAPAPRTLLLGTRTHAQHMQLLAARCARHRRVFDAVLTLSALRGGFGEGHRHWAAFHCALAGFRAAQQGTPALDAATVRQRVYQLTAGMRPPLSARETDAMLRSAYDKATKRGTPPSYATLAQVLAMTPDERLTVGLVVKTRTPRRLPVVARRERLRALVDASVTLGQGVPSQAAMVELLATKGVEASQATVSSDYHALGIASGRRGGRPRLPLRPPAGTVEL